ncbi:uncharacterized protein LOC106093387 [Stomoxys calcitrans]|uniref:uncharacterized protein LOC106093387 n=1 Tax=Stomoxys calcitrans TaxID=35570 RepID=UPI0027E35AD6|nr:uncharacterized protein LOC106093387 [Stomoxys calcitrans]
MADYHKTYIESHLIPEILKQLDKEELVSYTAEHCGGLDGFMSALYNISLKTKEGKGEKERLLIAKFMKGDVAFRESSKSYVQFANEIFIYAQVLPEFEKLLKELQLTTQININDLVPKCYKAAYGYIEGLSSSKDEEEAALVLENLKPLGYQMGPRLCLNRDHLLAMCKPVAKYHALSYALRALQPLQLDHLKSGLKVLPFVCPAHEAKRHLYTVLYRVAFERFYDFFDRTIDTNTFDRKSAKDLKLIEDLKKLKEKYFNEPHQLLEKLRTKVENNKEDRKFAVILHGDYNRNNVMFKYCEGGEGAEQKVENVKMIDFQEVRYGSPVLDLSFFMYFNSSEDIRADVWPELLETYHSHMFHTLEMILKSTNKSDSEIKEIMSDYSYEKFEAHFSRFAFYGVMICMHFLPWMLCSEDECARLSDLFDKDIGGEEFHKLSIEAGGDEVNRKILTAIRHASEMGYMDDL